MSSSISTLFFIATILSFGLSLNPCEENMNYCYALKDTGICRSNNNCPGFGGCSRNTLISVLQRDYCNDNVNSLQGADEQTLIGKLYVAVLLRKTFNVPPSILQGQNTADNRNTLIHRASGCSLLRVSEDNHCSLQGFNDVQLSCSVYFSCTRGLTCSDSSSPDINVFTFDFGTNGIYLMYIIGVLVVMTLLCRMYYFYGKNCGKNTKLKYKTVSMDSDTEAQ
eukprot:75104_1